MDVDLLSRAEAGELLRVSPRSLRRWALRRYGPLPFRVGNKVFYRMSDLIQFLDNRHDEAWAELTQEVSR